VGSAGDREELDSDEFETCPSSGRRYGQTAAVAPIILKTIRVLGSITVPFGPQEFETYPDWGATIFHKTSTLFQRAAPVNRQAQLWIRTLVRSPVPDDLVRRIAERFSPDKIILFGSSARGDASPDSDIDLLVLFSEPADPNKRAAELYASLVEFSRPMDIVVSTTSRFERYRNVVNTLYWPASREGKVLYERAA